MDDGHIRGDFHSLGRGNLVVRARDFSGCFVMLALSASALWAAPRDARLVEAVRKDDLAAARALVSQGVDVDDRAGDGATALQWAVYNENQELVDLLLRHGGSVNAANDLGVTPL